MLSQGIKNGQSQPIRLGYLRLNDAAPLLVAQHCGFFEQEGVRVQLIGELGWATICDKIVYGELDMAQALSSMPFVLSWGLNAIPCPCVTDLVLNMHGNGITLSEVLWQEGVKDGESLANYLSANAAKELIFGVVSNYSSHHFALLRWFESLGITQGVKVVVVPPAQMVRNLKAGTIDGYCAGEPWNSLAVAEGVGWTVLTRMLDSEAYPEKVLMTSRAFAESRREEYERVLLALLRALHFCNQPENNEEVVALLCRALNLRGKEKVVMRGFWGGYDRGHGKVEDFSGYIDFFGDEVNRPTSEKAERVFADLKKYGFLDTVTGPKPTVLSQLYRSSVYDQVVKKL